MHNMRMKSLFGYALLFVAAIGCSSPIAAAYGQGNNPNRVHQQKSLKVVKIEAAGHNIDSWVMDNEQKREEGMMFLTDKEVKSNQGMIFVFDTVQPNNGKYAFWMHNTLIPLDIIYISPAKKVINICAGKAMDDASLYPQGPYNYVLELKLGTAKRLGIKPGARLGIPPSLKAIE